MNKKVKQAITTSLLTISIITTAAYSAETVTVDNFPRAETDMTFDRYVKQGAFGKMFHMRMPTQIDKQDVIRMNRDTIYSFTILDLTEPATIVKPDSGDRFMSLMTINQDHSIPAAEYGSGEFVLTQKEIGSRYVFVAFRTFVDPSKPEDLKAAHALQDQIKIKQSDKGSFNVPDWDEKSLHAVRDAVNVLANTKSDTREYWGDKDKLNPIQHLLGTAFGWGGNPKEDAIYVNGVPSKNDGKTPYVLTVKDVPVNSFWSLTVYNKDGFMEKNKQDAYSFNSVTSKPNADGSITLHFGGDSSKSNYLPITDGWNYIVRLYQPKKEIIDGTWEFPKPVEAK